MFKVELLIQAKDGVEKGTHSLIVSCLFVRKANNLVNSVQHMIVLSSPIWWCTACFHH